MTPTPATLAPFGAVTWTEQIDLAWGYAYNVLDWLGPFLALALALLLGGYLLQRIWSMLSGD